MIMAHCDCFICNGFWGADEDDCFNKNVNKDAEPVTPEHKCSPKEYVGILDKFFYCDDCGKKWRDDE